MPIPTKELLLNLTKDTQHIIKTAQAEILPLSEHQRTWKSSTEKWSVAECLEHLNIYGRYYLPQIQQALQKNTDSSPKTNYSGGWLGNYFVNSMLPKEQAVANKMKTPKGYNPTNLPMKNQNYLQDFLDQQQQILQLLEEAQNVNLQKIKIPISLSKWLKIRLGDTFRFVIAHNQRHVLQAQNVIKIENFPKQPIA